MSFSAHEFKSLLDAAGVERARVEPSAVQQSPYDYVYVFLSDVTDPRWDDEYCPHLVISDAAEYGDEGIIVGRFKTHTDEAAINEIVPSDAHALVWVLEQVRA